MWKVWSFLFSLKQRFSSNLHGLVFLTVWLILRPIPANNHQTLYPSQTVQYPFLSIADSMPCWETGRLSCSESTQIRYIFYNFISANSCQLSSPLLYSKQLHRVKDISREFVFYLSNRAEVWNTSSNFTQLYLPKRLLFMNMLLKTRKNSSVQNYNITFFIERLIWWK